MILIFLLIADKSINKNKYFIFWICPPFCYWLHCSFSVVFQITWVVLVFCCRIFSKGGEPFHLSARLALLCRPLKVLMASSRFKTSILDSRSPILSSPFCWLKQHRLDIISLFLLPSRPLKIALIFSVSSSPSYTVASNELSHHYLDII